MDNRSTRTYGFMSRETLEIIVKKAIEKESLANANRECVFAFQGGEPLLAGKDFYRWLISYVQAYNDKRVRVSYAIQTNGTLIDDEWAEFFTQHGFLVGLSLDGTKEIHDRHRLDATGNPTFTSVMKAAAILTAHKTQFNILTVVTPDVARHISKIYGFYKKNNLLYQQYIPCIAPLPGTSSDESSAADIPSGHICTPRQYGDFLCNLFDIWYRDYMEGLFVYERLFVNLINLIGGHPPESCGMLGVCSTQYLVEADGSVFPCDFYALDQMLIGDFTTDSFEDIEQKRKQLGFIETSRQTHADCPKCKWYRICYGGCRRYREPIMDGKLGKNILCEAYRMLFDYALDRMLKISKGVKT